MTAASIAVPTRRHGRVVLGEMTEAGRPLTFGEAMAALAREPAARQALTAALAAAPFAAFFWECAPATAGLREPFCFALVDSPPLAAVTADPAPFRAPLAAAGGEVATFASLGRESLLVAPPLITPRSAGAHLAAFVRGAPAAAVDALWQAVPAAVARWFGGGAPVGWLSTSGLAVHWLHVRIDPRPKYYTHAPFRAAPGGVAGAVAAGGGRVGR
ncbi:MAG: hypothetical protein H6701_06630 [Myxococcales bacterium]|nr:hypothetical protein [Myxococcales bacterium]